jgi:predicted outer membrane repeat protein
VLIDGNCFNGNTAFNGPAIYMSNSSANVMISNNIFVNNIAISNFGGAIYTEGMTGTVMKVANTFIGNYNPVIGGIIDYEANNPSPTDARLLQNVSNLIPSSAIIYVNLNAKGNVRNGLTWATAFVKLQDALAASAATPYADQIWVAKGNYSTTTTFLVPDGAALFGGFLGTETSLAQRSNLNVTQLSPSKGVTNIVTMDGAAAILDGFSMFNVSGSRGVYATNNSNLLLFNMQFNNITYSGNGTAIASENASSVTVMASQFSNITTGGLGGAIYSKDGNSLVIGYSQFNNIKATNGGAVYSDGFTAIHIIQSKFNNLAAVSGGGALSVNNNVGTLVLNAPDCCGNVVLGDRGSLIIEASNFVNNTKTTGANANGGAILAMNVQDLQVLDSIFTGSTAKGSGGAIYSAGNLTDGNVLIKGNTFTGNTAVNGGAVYTAMTGTGIISLLLNSFVNNTATKGGAYYDQSSAGVSLIIKGNDFQNNKASQGKAIWLGGMTDKLNDKNKADWMSSLLENNTNLSNQIFIV